MKVIFAPEAVDDLEEAVRYLTIRNPQSADQLAERIFDTIDKLANWAFDGPTQTLAHGEQVQSWPVRPYRVYYQRQADSFHVLRIYHQARKPIVR